MISSFRAFNGAGLSSVRHSRSFFARHFSSSNASTSSLVDNSTDVIGFVGLGHMGSRMCQNLVNDGRKILVYDIDTNKKDTVVSTIQSSVGDKEMVNSVDNVKELGSKCNIVITMLPNDNIVRITNQALMDGLQKSQNENITTSTASKPFVHISCSTISPTTSRSIVSDYSKMSLPSGIQKQPVFITSPVFARPDGIGKRQATWMIAGSSRERQIAQELLDSSGHCVDYGDDVGASNVVKLCGNFLIASTIESISEAMALAEKHNVDRQAVMQMLSGSIFDCLIYKGYGQRVSERDHRPGGFSLELGYKDCTLVKEAAKEVNVRTFSSLSL